MIPRFIEFHKLFSRTCFILNYKRLKIIANRGNRFELISITPPNFNYPLYLRKGTSDIRNFRQIFKEEEYSFLPFQPNTILDLGGYIGLASAYFANKYPNAKIVLIEPDPDNFLVAQLNTRQFPNVECLQVGVWSESCYVTEDRKPGDSLESDWGKVFRKVTSDENSVSRIQALSIPVLMSIVGFAEIDFLKIDIEGCEKNLFSDFAAGTWIDKCRLISCELHDRFVPGCSEAFHNAMAGKGFDIGKHGEFEFYVRDDYVKR